MFTIDDFNIEFNDSDGITSLTFDELDFDNIFSLDLFGICIIWSMIML